MHTPITLLGIVLFASILITGQAPAQTVAFTGFVDQDFQGATYIPDAQGVDVVMTGPLYGSMSGWDMMGLAVHYDKSTDKLMVGIDTHGICGDADGNGYPSQTDYYLYMSGGIDQAHMGGGEALAVCFDFDDDGVGDVIAGIPPGASVYDFRVAEVLPGSSLAQSYLAFGHELSAHNGGVLGSPVSTCPDMEFSLTDFCSLMDQYGTPGQSHIGIHVFLGSFDDAMIPEDFISGPTINEFRRVPVHEISGGLPILNNLTLVDIELENNYWKFTGGYTKQGGFIGCLLFSIFDNPQGTWFGPPYNINILVGNGSPSSVIMEEFNAPISVMDCEYFEDSYYGPIWLQNWTYYVQAFQFRAVFDPSAPYNFLASNRVIVAPSAYPSLNN